MRKRLATAVIAASFVIGLAPAAWANPEPDPTKQCKKGRVPATAPGSAFDENQNGFVCVDPVTGGISDDKEQFAPDEPGSDADDNNNFFVCYNPQTGVTTDDEITIVDGGPVGMCPPGFILVPAS